MIAVAIDLARASYDGILEAFWQNFILDRRKQSLSEFMELIGRIRSKMTTLGISGFVFGVIVSIIWNVRIFETFFEAWWFDWIMGGLVFAVGVYVLERQIGKICGIIDEELGKLGKASTKQSERT